MAVPAFVGDEVTAAGYRLAGARVRVPAAGDETATLAFKATDHAYRAIDIHPN